MSTNQFSRRNGGDGNKWTAVEVAGVVFDVERVSLKKVRVYPTERPINGGDIAKDFAWRRDKSWPKELRGAAMFAGARALGLEERASAVKVSFSIYCGCAQCPCSPGWTVTPRDKASKVFPSTERIAEQLETRGYITKRAEKWLEQRKREIQNGSGSAHYTHEEYAELQAIKGLEEQIYLPCPGEAHRNAFIDNCGVCAPRWGRLLNRERVR